MHMASYDINITIRYDYESIPLLVSRIAETPVLQAEVLEGHDLFH